jgi:hypothetical protein
LYNGIRELLVFWTIIAERVNPQIRVGEELDDLGEPTGKDQMAGVGDMVRGFKNWKIIAPEITPRDNADVARLEIEKQGALLSSKRASMDQIGVESPEAEIKIIEQEQSNLKINPAAVQQQVSVLTIAAQLEQLRMQNQQLAAQIQGLGQEQGAPGSVLGPNQEDNVAAQAQAAGQQQGLNPRQAEDQNQAATGPGGAPPSGAAPPGGAEGPATLQTLSRQGGDNLNQIAFSSGGGQ